jgi:integrase
MHPYIIVSLLTGARTEELRALRWEHVHLYGRSDITPPIPPFVEVWRSVRAGGDTKTMKSRRTIALPDLCVMALLTQRAQQDAERRAAGGRPMARDRLGINDTARYRECAPGLPPRSGFRSWHES